MTNRNNSADYSETDDLLMNDDVDFADDDLEDEQEDRPLRSRSFNLDMRHRIEDRLEEKRLQKELNEYEFFDIDEDDLLH